MPTPIDRDQILHLARAVEILEKQPEIDGVVHLREAGKLLQTFFELCRKQSLEPDGEVLNQVNSILSIADGLQDAGLKETASRRCKAEGAKLLSSAIRQASPLVSYLSLRLAGQEVSSVKDKLERLYSDYNQALNREWIKGWSSPFEQEVEAQRKASRWWLCATVFLFAVAAGVAVFVARLSLNPTAGLSLGQSVQVGLGKMLLFSTSITAAVWASRNYRTARHNIIVNAFRVNSMRTFDDVLKVAKDDPTRNAVLLQITASIFASQSSGFLVDSEKLTGGPTDTLHELIRLVKTN